MKTSRTLLAAFFAVSILSISAFAADLAGNWKWTSVTTHGGPAEVTALLKVKAGVITGTVTGRQGPGEITDGTFKEGALAFTVIRTAGVHVVTFKYAGTLEGDTITGSILKSDAAVKDAPATKTDWKATRVK